MGKRRRWCRTWRSLLKRNSVRRLCEVRASTTWLTVVAACGQAAGRGWPATLVVGFGWANPGRTAAPLLAHGATRRGLAPLAAWRVREGSGGAWQGGRSTCGGSGAPPCSTRRWRDAPGTPSRRDAARSGGLVSLGCGLIYLVRLQIRLGAVPTGGGRPVCAGHAAAPHRQCHGDSSPEAWGRGRKERGGEERRREREGGDKIKGK